MSIKENITKIINQIISDLQIEDDKKYFFELETFDMKIDKNELDNLYSKIQHAITSNARNLSIEETSKLEKYEDILNDIIDYVDEANSAAIKYTGALYHIEKNMSELKKNFYDIETLSNEIDEIDENELKMK